MSKEWLDPTDVPGGMAGFEQGVWFCRATDMPAKDLTHQNLARFLAASLLGPGAETRTIGCVRLAPGATGRGTGWDCNAFFAFADSDIPRVLAALASTADPTKPRAGEGAALARAFRLERYTAAVAAELDPAFLEAYPPPST